MFLVWERKIAVQIGSTLSLFNGVSLETGKIICCKKARYEGSVMRCQKQFAAFPWQQSFFGGTCTVCDLSFLLQSNKFSLCLRRFSTIFVMFVKLNNCSVEIAVIQFQLLIPKSYCFNASVSLTAPPESPREARINLIIDRLVSVLFLQIHIR